MSLNFYLYTPLINFSASIRFSDAFAFGAPKVIGHFITIWMITYADNVIVVGMDSAACVPSLLYASDIGRRTSVLFLHNSKPDGDSLEVARYIWDHNSQRPNSNTYPLSCPLCNTVQSWCPANSVLRPDGDSFVLKCLAKKKENGKSVQCPGTYVVDRRPPSTEVKSPYVGIWYSLNPGE